ncbi:hypothetical protein AB1Y20_013177 [Prymnesium parvum]|uniref:JmjC domain-containing protein n=1 Tax=Prymnesium parvum TaxID=97485 RepID=A0AB34IMW7_PRYPA
MELCGSSVDMLLDGSGLAPVFREAAHFDSVVELPPGSRHTDLHPFVLRNQPVVLRGALLDWLPVERWGEDEYLRSAGAGRRVGVRCAEEGTSTFGDVRRRGVYNVAEVEWCEFLDSLDAAEQPLSTPQYYAAQLRLKSVLPTLYRDTHPPPSLLAALGVPWRSAPSAYIGCSSRTPIHFDLLENLFCMVRGRKRIQIWHPAHGKTLCPGGGGELLFSNINLTTMDEAMHPDFVRASQLAHVVELEAGDALYLPCGWWHAISSTQGSKCISISYWTQPPDMKGSSIVSPHNLQL